MASQLHWYLFHILSLITLLFGLINRQESHSQERRTDACYLLSVTLYVIQMGKEIQVVAIHRSVLWAYHVQKVLSTQKAAT